MNQGSLWPFKPSRELQKYFADSDADSEGKKSKEILKSSRLEFLEKFLGNNFILSDEEDNTSRPLNRIGIADLPMMRTINNLPKSEEPSLWKVTDAFALVTYGSLEASKIIVQLLLAFTLDFEDLLCRYKRKNLYELWTMAAAQAAENHQDEWRLTWYWWWGMYTSILTWNYSQNLLAAAEALCLKISSKSLKWSQIPF